VGSQKKLAAIRRWLTRHTIPDGIRDVVIKKRWSRRDNGKIGPGTILYEEPLKNRSLRKGIGCSRNGTVA
jgi:hypothetical protein